MSRFVTRFLKNESGATAIEYGLIAALISVAIIVGATAVGPHGGEVLGMLSLAVHARGTHPHRIGARSGDRDTPS